MDVTLPSKLLTGKPKLQLAPLELFGFRKIALNFIVPRSLLAKQQLYACSKRIWRTPKGTLSQLVWEQNPSRKDIQSRMPKRSAGLLMYRRCGSDIEVFLVHPGGPLWANKDLGSWSIPKGEYLDDEQPLETAKREFQEETGFTAEGDFIPLGDLRQPGGKTILAWALEGDCDPMNLRSNTIRIHWPPRSGRQLEIPEVDRGSWFTIEDARARLLKGQLPFLDRLLQKTHR